MLFYKLLLLLFIIKFSAAEEVCIPRHIESGKWSDHCQDLEMEKQTGKDWKRLKQTYIEFRDAVLKDDRQKVASMIKFPLNFLYQPQPVHDYTDWKTREKYIKLVEIKDKKEFLDKYDFIFTDRLLFRIETTPYNHFMIRPGLLKMLMTYGSVDIYGRCKDTLEYDKKCDEFKIDYINNDIALLELP